MAFLPLGAIGLELEPSFSRGKKCFGLVVKTWLGHRNIPASTYATKAYNKDQDSSDEEEERIQQEHEDDALRLRQLKREKEVEKVQRLVLRTHGHKARRKARAQADL